MPTIIIETRIAAPIERCFDLARDVLAHSTTSRFTDERVVEPGRTSGLLEEGELVTFEGVHFAIRQRLTARITEMARPRMFVDEQVKGAFHTLRHLHEFERIASGTLMRDTITWRSPFGILGRIADPFVGRHLRQFVTRKQEALRRLAESNVVLPLRTATP